MKNLFKITFKIFLGIFLAILVSGNVCGQDLTKFSNRTCNNGGDLSTTTTNWQTISGNIASNGFTRHDVYLTSGRQYIFSLCSDDGGAASIDTYMALFKGWGCDKYTSENLLAYNDDGCGTASKITYTANFTGWATLYITAYYSNTSGTYTLKYKYVDNSTPSGPTNSTCTNAIALDCGTTLNGTTVGTSGEAHGLPSSASTSKYGVWYTFTGTGGDTKIIVTPASGYDTKISVVSGSCGSFTWVGSADNGGSGYADTYTFSTTSGTRYYVYVAHYSSSSTTTGTFTISRECPGPANSTCETATRLDCGATLNGTTIGTTGTAHSLPSSASVSNYGVWYTFVGNGAPTTISVHATGYDTEIDIVSGSCGSFTWIGYNDSGNSTTSNDTYSFTTVAGTTYYVYVAHYSSTSSTTGTFTISHSCDPPAPREMLCGTTYSGTLGLYGVWNSYTSCGYNEPGEEHIYEFTAPVDGSYTFSTTSSGDPDFFLMTDYDNTSTNLIGACWGSGNKTVTLEEGETYYVVADNYSSSSTATYTLSVTCPTQTYTVTYNANGGTGTMTDSNSPYNAGSTVTTMTNTFTNIGYTFAGWNTVGNGSGTAYAEGATFTINEDITLYAQWTQQISTCENFDSYPSSTYGNSGVIPNGWDMIYNGTTIGYEPHISTNIYNNSLCNNNGIAFAGNSSTEYGAYNYIILPEYDDDIIRVSFDYKYENATYGTLTIGYISNLLDENTYTILETPERIAGTCTNVEYILEGRVPQNNRLAFCWNAYNGTLDWSCGIDNVCVETNHLLPITLRYFNATPRSDGKNILKWSTAYESQNSNFEIYRTNDILSNHWESVVTLWQGTTDKPRGDTYMWLDEQPYDTTYYMLVQNDLDGGFETFRSEMVVCIQEHKTTFDEPYVICDNVPQAIAGSEVCEVFVQNVLGQVVEEFKLDPYQQREVLAEIQGMYLITFVYKHNGEARKKTEKIICM